MSKQHGDKMSGLNAYSHSNIHIDSGNVCSYQAQTSCRMLFTQDLPMAFSDSIQHWKCEKIDSGEQYRHRRQRMTVMQLTKDLCNFLMSLSHIICTLH